MRIFDCLLFLVLTPVVWANLVVKNPATGSTTTYTSAVFRYFSKNEDRTMMDYPVISIEGKSLCNPTSDLVSRKIVIANFEVGAEILCWPIEAAKECAKLGAVAFVVTSIYSPPGLVSNIHWTMDPESESTDIPFVGITAADVGDVELELWRDSMMDGMTATIGPPYIRVYWDLFTSPLWIVVFQIFLPGCALLVTCESVAEIRRRTRAHIYAATLQNGQIINWKSFVTAPVAVCMVEAISSFIIATLFAFGEYGPLYLPYAYHYFFLSLLSGSSFFTTILIALILHEQSKFLRGQPSRKDVMVFYRKTIASCALICIGSDLLIGAVTAFEPRAAYGNFTSFFGVYAFGQIIVAIYFFSRAWELYRPLSAYLNHPESSPRSDNETQLRFLVHNLTISGSAMLLNTGCVTVIAVFATGDIRVTSTYIWFVGIFLFSASRIGVSYSQVIERIVLNEHALIILQSSIYSVIIAS